jgi:23S rRNA (uridine2552-2'-O)-methyltransferase
VARAVGTRWQQDRARDPYIRQARSQGYRARSAFKLKQLQNRFHIVRKGDVAVDLGAAPGGWTQVLVELVGDGGTVIGVDIRRIAAIPGARLLKGDLTHRETHERLAEELRAAGRDHVDVVLSDMSPDIGGSYVTDQARSVHLCRMALRFAVAHLRTGGHFCCKVFEGEDFAEFRDEVRARFARVMQFHPPASRKQSSEVYLVATSFLGVGGPGRGVAPSEE